VDLHGAADVIGLAIDAVGVFVIALWIAIAAVRFLCGLTGRQPFDNAYRQLGLTIGRGILLGLELLVAGDIIRTVAIAPSFTSIGVVAMIVAIRTFLSFSLEVELTGRWPWQASAPSTWARDPPAPTVSPGKRDITRRAPWAGRPPSLRRRLPCTR
jgi:uncharacterized membrane protein